MNIRDAQSGIRTHEACAVDLESTPFDRSGICAKNIHDGTRTRNPQIRSLVRYPITLHGLYSH